MVNYYGTGRGSHIAGSSVHNQRIMWSTRIDKHHTKGVQSESDLFVLHLVFLSMINKTLKDFAHAWNLHPLRTEANWSPMGQQHSSSQ